MIHVNKLVEGRFTVRVLDAETEEVKREYQFKNLVLNSGLDRLGANTPGGSTACIDVMYLSTSTTTPVVTDTAMGGTQITSTASSPIFATQEMAGTSPDWTWTYQFGRRWTAGTATGTWSMVGVGWSGGLFAKTLIKDSGGTPTSITILASEILDVRYELKVVPDVTTRGPFNITINGTVYSYTLRNFYASVSNHMHIARGFGTDSSGSSPSATIVGAGIGATVTHATVSGGGTGPLTGSVGHSGTPVACGTATMSAYTTGNYYRDVTFPWATTDLVSNDKIVCIAMRLNCTAGYVSMLFAGGAQAGGVPKTNLDTFSMTVRVSWNRV